MNTKLLLVAAGVAVLAFFWLRKNGVEDPANVLPIPITDFNNIPVNPDTGKSELNLPEDDLTDLGFVTGPDPVAGQPVTTGPGDMCYAENVHTYWVGWIPCTQLYASNAGTGIRDELGREYLDMSKEWSAAPAPCGEGGYCGY